MLSRADERRVGLLEQTDVAEQLRGHKHASRLSSTQQSTRAVAHLHCTCAQGAPATGTFSITAARSASAHARRSAAPPMPTAYADSSVAGPPGTAALQGGGASAQYTGARALPRGPSWRMHARLHCPPRRRARARPGLRAPRRTAPGGPGCGGGPGTRYLRGGALEVEEQERGPVKDLHGTPHYARLARHAVVARAAALHAPSPPRLSQHTVGDVCSPRAPSA